eukprot:PhM_4_TR2051/c1_g2_i3/m.9379
MIGGRCNLVALSPKGVHLFFRHHPRLKRGFSRPDLGFDIRTYDNTASDIILVEPSADVKTLPDGTIEQAKYTWLVVPNLLVPLQPCPDDIVLHISRVSAKTTPKRAQQRKPSPNAVTARRPRKRKTPPHERLDAPPPSDHTTLAHRSHPGLQLGSWNMNRQALGTMAELMSLASDTDIMALHYGTSGDRSGWRNSGACPPRLFRLCNRGGPRSRNSPDNSPTHILFVATTSRRTATGRNGYNGLVHSRNRLPHLLRFAVSLAEPTTTDSVGELHPSADHGDDARRCHSRRLQRTTCQLVPINNEYRFERISHPRA